MSYPRECHVRELNPGVGLRGECVALLAACNKVATPRDNASQIIESADEVNNKDRHKLPYCEPLYSPHYIDPL